MFSEIIINDIKAHAIRDYPNESCGFIVDEEYIPFENKAENPEEMLSNFLRTTYEAAVRVSDWDRKKLERH